MTTPKKSGEKLYHLLDALAEHVSELPDRELLEDATVEGRTDAARSRIQHLLLSAAATPTSQATIGHSEDPLDTSGLSLSSLLRRLKAVGVERDFLYGKFLPSASAATTRPVGKKKAADEAEVLAHLVPLLSQVFNWPVDVLLGDGDLPPLASAAAAARFKLPANAESRRTLVVAAYARYLAGLVLVATPPVAAKVLPTNPRQLRRIIIDTHGDLSLRSALSYAWDLGVPVLPLNDSGGFHGATWRVRGRNVVVLKQRTPFEARWLHDLFHELWHTAEDESSSEFEAVDLDVMPKERRESPEEQAATAFAGDVMLDGRAEELAEACVRDAQGRMEFLKAAVPRVAARTGVAVDALANYLAFRLSLQGKNWWGAAANLQTSGTPWSIARDFLVDRLDFVKLAELDRALLLRALEASPA